MTDLFRIRDHVPDWDNQVAEYRRASAATRATLRSRLDVAYGDHSDERLDLFFPAGEARERPLHLFVHGGYWRAFTKDDYAFIADAVTHCGAIAAIMDYSLMPLARMATLVDQVRRAALWLCANAESIGGAPGRLSASGHSAGGHLVSYLAQAGPGEAALPPATARAILAVSGLYDLDPISRSFLQQEVHFQAGEIASWSPLGARSSPDVRWEIMVGAEETAPFREQATAMVEHLSAQGCSPLATVAAGHDHMSIVRALGTPGTAPAARLAATIAGGSR